MNTTIPLEDIAGILKGFEENCLQPGVPEFPELEIRDERFKMLRRAYWAIAIAEGKTLAMVNQERGELLPEEYVKTSDPIDATVPDYLTVSDESKLWLVYINNDGNEHLYAYPQEEAPTTEQIQTLAESEGIELDESEDWEELVYSGCLEGGEVKLSFFGPYSANELYSGNQSLSASVTHCKPE